MLLVIIPYAIDYKDGERGRNRTFNLLIKSRRIRRCIPRVSTFNNQYFADNQARTEALCSGIEKTRVSAYGIEWYGTLMAHLWATDSDSGSTDHCPDFSPFAKFVLKFSHGSHGQYSR